MDSKLTELEYEHPLLPDGYKIERFVHPFKECYIYVVINKDGDECSEWGDTPEEAIQEFTENL